MFKNKRNTDSILVAPTTGVSKKLKTSAKASQFRALVSAKKNRRLFAIAKTGGSRG